MLMISMGAVCGVGLVLLLFLLLLLPMRLSMVIIDGVGAMVHLLSLFLLSIILSFSFIVSLVSLLSAIFFSIWFVTKVTMELGLARCAAAIGVDGFVDDAVDVAAAGTLKGSTDFGISATFGAGNVHVAVVDVPAFVAFVIVIGGTVVGAKVNAGAE